MRQMSEEDFAEMMMDAEDMDDGIPYGYYMDEEHAMPYNGHHYMHNNNNNHNGGNHQARTGSKQKKRANSHTRGTPTYKAKNFHNMQNKKNKK
ncbi:hypothetical protein ADEAN_000800100 [Angomonas deanei]|uniref:Uncharacterized protein n=1 Tax=Angomonas deanei TaxID=59799 RepID=A0A7G2CM24_9TRYP|nr:hypothetical protein ADEAN_000800100 [Angomonas deanei]